MRHGRDSLFFDNALQVREEVDRAEREPEPPLEADSPQSIEAAGPSNPYEAIQDTHWVESPLDPFSIQTIMDPCHLDFLLNNPSFFMLLALGFVRLFYFYIYMKKV